MAVLDRVEEVGLSRPHGGLAGVLAAAVAGKPRELTRSVTLDTQFHDRPGPPAGKGPPAVSFMRDYRPALSMREDSEPLAGCRSYRQSASGLAEQPHLPERSSRDGSADINPMTDGLESASMAPALLAQGQTSSRYGQPASQQIQNISEQER